MSLDRCWLVNKLSTDGGGNSPSGIAPIVIRRTAALGDTLAASVVADKLADLGYSVVFQTHPASHCLMRRRRSISRVEEPKGDCHVNLDGCYENDPHRTQKHFYQMFVASANQQLSRLGINLGYADNCAPKLMVWPHEKAFALRTLEKYPKPWVFICPRSHSYQARTVPDDIWARTAPQIQGTKFWIGLHPSPPGITDLGLRHMDLVIAYLACADVLVTTDTGPMHIAAAFGVPVVALGQSSSPEQHLSDQQDFEVIWPEGLDCLNCQKNICPKNPDMPPCQRFNPDVIAQAVNRKLQTSTTENVSAVVAIYKPEVGMLNKCLTSLLPQVQEIVVAMEGDSVVPHGANLDRKIRYIRKEARGIGYSRNQNHAVRHSSGKYILLSNDDVEYKPNAVAKMLEVIKADPKVGLVSNLLRYPDGTIYHSGKVRAPGVRGWGHVSYRNQDPAYYEPTEMENVCGCVNLVTRKAFYEIGGYDEEFYLFSQDDAFSLSMRKHGYKVMFTPHSEATHWEHQSVAKVGQISQLVSRDNAVFDRKWHKYLDHNIGNAFGNFNYT